MRRAHRVKTIRMMSAYARVRTCTESQAEVDALAPD
jgi:hypothetical protein